jgi:Tfp pilus assembly protein PilP
MIKIITLILCLTTTALLADKKQDPFYKDLPLESLKRHDFSDASLYSVQSLKLVATLLAPEFKNLNELRAKNQIPNSAYKNLALLELPGNGSQVVVYEGQKIGKNNALVKKISKNQITLEENNKQITMEITE